MADSLNDANLNPGTGPARGLLLNEDGDLAFSGGGMVVVRGVPAVLQEVRTRWRFWRGESFMDVTAGIDFRGEVFTKPPNLPAAQSAFRRELLAVREVESVQEVTAEYHPAERRLTLTFKATMTDGTALAGAVEV